MLNTFIRIRVEHRKYDPDDDLRSYVRNFSDHLIPVVDFSQAAAIIDHINGNILYKAEFVIKIRVGRTHLVLNEQDMHELQHELNDAANEFYAASKKPPERSLPRGVKRVPKFPFDDEPISKAAEEEIED